MPHVVGGQPVDHGPFVQAEAPEVRRARQRGPQQAPDEGDRRRAGGEERAHVEADGIPGSSVVGPRRTGETSGIREDDPGAGVPPAQRAVLQACLDEGEIVLAKGHLAEGDVDRWAQLNRTFHAQIVDSTGSRVIADAIARNNHLPFASADSITVDKRALDQALRKLQLAQMQHRLIVDALLGGESARAESLMREHALIGLRYNSLFGDLPAGA